jgi:hypothetical protein
MTEMALVVQRAYDWNLWILPKVEKFPKTHRFSVRKSGGSDGNQVAPVCGKRYQQPPGGSPSRTTTSPEICHPAERVTSSLHQVLTGSLIARRKSPIALSEDRWSGGVLGNAQLKPSTVQLVPAAEIH